MVFFNHKGTNNFCHSNKPSGIGQFRRLAETSQAYEEEVRCILESLDQEREDESGSGEEEKEDLASDSISITSENDLTSEEDEA